jgi:hypothetical protein
MPRISTVASIRRRLRLIGAAVFAAVEHVCPFGCGPGYGE